MLRVYAVFDSKVEAFMTPFFVRTRGEALRAFQDSVNQENSSFRMHPADFTLFELGDWDELHGQFTLLKTPYSLGLAQDFLVKA